jgi:CubicO group peptidase (beta-lactamase class C family)
MPARATAKKAATPAKKNGFQTPVLPKAKPESVGLSTARLKALSETINREIDKGTLPGAVVMVGRKGKVAHFDALGRQRPDSDARMRPDSVFRIFSMTKPIVSVAIMQLVEDGKLLINDPLSKYIPSFARTQVGEVRDGKIHLVPVKREITIQDLLSHTSGI